MNRLSTPRPSPAFVVATRALVAAVAGAAVAGQDASTSAVTKKKVKRISEKVANAEITERAPGLSVGNSDQLDNLSSTQLTPAASDNRTNDLTLTATDQTVLSANIATATSSILVVSSALQVDGTGGRPDCHLRFDGTSVQTFFATSVPSGEASLAVAGSQSVGAGTHTVELRCNAQGTVSVDEGALTATAHPQG